MCNNIYFFLSILIIFLCPYSAHSELIFCDDFESGDMAHSTNGFLWTDSVYISIVRNDQFIVWKEKNKSEIGPHVDRNWENSPASTGSHSLRFLYKKNKFWAEQRFFLGGGYPELWMSYWIRVPINYTHGTIDRKPGFRNQKFSALWTEGYTNTSDQPVIVFNFWDRASDWADDESSGSSYSTISISNMSNGPASHQEQFGNFIKFPEDRGRWMHIVARYKIASYRGAEDGIVQWWRRWFDESEYTLISDRRNLGIGVNKGPSGFTGGYLMGWANGAYKEDAEFLIDDFKVSTTSLFGEGLVSSTPHDEIDKLRSITALKLQKLTEKIKSKLP